MLSASVKSDASSETDEPPGVHGPDHGAAMSDVRPPRIAWRSRAAVLGGVYALPAAIVALSDPSHGFALALGVLPGAVAGPIPTRRGRLAIVVLGMCIGVPMFIGGVLADVPVLAVAAIAGAGVGASVVASRARLGQLAMNLSLPMFGVGLSYPGFSSAAGLAGLMVVGSAFACLVSMLWPERPPPTRRSRPAPAGPTLAYGIRLGAAGATAAAIGFALNLEHVGWACAAALLVMRPAAEMQRLRSVGRILSVAIGALAAIILVHINPPEIVYSVAALVTISAAGATYGSRWYVTPAFTTFLVFLLLLYSHPHDAASRFDERLLETALGVGLAYFFGLALPAFVRVLRDRRSSGSGDAAPA